MDAALARQFMRRAQLATLTINELGWNLDEKTVDQSLEAARLALLDHEAARDGFLTLLERLEQHTTQSKTFSTVVADLLGKVRQRAAACGEDLVWYRPPTPFETCFLQGRAPFFDRQPLRNKVQALSGGTCRVLVINGASRTGKSYSVRFLSFLAMEQAAFGPNFRLATVDLRDMRSSQIDVPFLVGNIMAQIDPSTPVEPHAAAGQASHQGHQQAARLAALADSHTPQGRRTFCIVLDHFDASLLPDDVRSFINHLAMRAAQSRGLRLVLVGYPGQELPFESQDVVEEEKLGPPTSTDVMDFFTKVHEHKNVAPAATSQTLYDEVIGKVTLAREDPMFLSQLARAAKARVLELFP
ncbi:hypothetical protein A8M77_03480 [Variovorax sp. JS1663]|nr:hypothetical protein A8M77_03480 [Variovorax sp. JS1663]